MDEAKRVEALLALYKQQMEHFRHSQQIEWKANFGVWTLLAGAIYVVPKDAIHIPHCLAAIALFLVAFIHAAWLLKLHESEMCDKELWIRYRNEVLPLIRGNDTIHKHEKPWERSLGQQMTWLSLAGCGKTLIRPVQKERLFDGE